MIRINQMFKYEIKKINSDFIVNEVSLLPKFSTKEESSYTYIWLKKEGLTTFEAIDIIKNFFSLTFEDINAEGLKDEDGITYQIISLKKILILKDIRLFNKNYSNKIDIERIVGYGKNPVLEKKLHGNQFNIILRSINETNYLKLENFLNKNKYFSFINYYDNQRFGLPGGPYNTYKIGKALIEKKWNEANKQYLISGNKDNVDFNLLESNQKYFIENNNLKKILFYISSYHSFLWNEAVSNFLQKENKNCKKIDIQNIGRFSIPIDINKTALPVDYEMECLDMDIKNIETFKKREKRRLVITTPIYLIDSITTDNKKFNVELSFYLPTGCYATMCVNQLFEQI